MIMKNSGLLPVFLSKTKRFERNFEGALANIQKCYILPEWHAFLGGNALDRFENRETHLEFCDNILSDLNRTNK
jgi:hypothetical protein